MEFDTAIVKKRACDAIAAALLGGLLYAVAQAGTRSVLLGGLFELLYKFCIYLLLPFAFSGLLLAAVLYAVNRLRDYCDRDMAAVILLAAALALAFYVTAPVLGELVIVKVTAVLFVFRLLRQFR